MYGSRVHEAVIENNEKQSGITIHFVNENYDEGEIILQARCKVEANETPDSLAQKIHTLEHAYFPTTIKTHLPHHTPIIYTYPTTQKTPDPARP